MKIEKKSFVFAIILIAIALLSLFVFSGRAVSAETYTHTIEALEEKRETVLRLTAASTTASTVISMVPGDAGTPIANKLVDFSSYFLLVLSAIVLEKYLLTVTGFLTFKVLIPFGCLIGAVNQFVRKRFLTSLASKLIVFGVALVMVIPTSVTISNIIETTYNDSITQVIEAAEESDISVVPEAAEEADETEKKGFFSSITDKIKDTTTGTIEWAEEKLNDLVEALSIMLVTTCAIPLLIILFYIWLCKIVLGLEIAIPTHHRMHHRH